MRHVTIPPPLLGLARDQAGLVAAHQCEAAGLSAHSRRRLVESGSWLRPCRGLYNTRTVDIRTGDWDGRRARAFWHGVLAAGPDAVAVGLGALWWQGVWGVPVGVPLPAGLPNGRGTDGPPGVRIRRFADPWDTVVVRGQRVVTVETALIQAVPEVGRNRAISLLDSALNRGYLDPARLPVIRDGIRGRRGAAAVHDWWHLIDPRSESPLESLARLDSHDHGLPPDELQLVVADRDGVFLGRGDLAWRGRRRWVVAEMDGIEEHSKPTALLGDRRRQNAMQNRGSVIMLRFTSVDVGASGTVTRDVHQALREA